MEVKKQAVKEENLQNAEKEKYEELILEVFYFDCSDVITDSPEHETRPDEGND
ncbi:MAG: hypothetical protein IKZ41_02925 [Clostridia bacterium]|nr:hypothetical protein [Clostridia bacterium]